MKSNYHSFTRLWLIHCSAFFVFQFAKYLDTVSEGLLILETFNTAVPLVRSYMVVYSSVLFGFVVLYHNIYGPSIEVFSDFNGSRGTFLTLLVMFNTQRLSFCLWKHLLCMTSFFWSF